MLKHRGEITLPPPSDWVLTDERLASLAALHTARELMNERRRELLLTKYGKDPLIVIRDGVCIHCSQSPNLPLLIKYDVLWKHYCSNAECPECWEINNE